MSDGTSKLVVKVPTPTIIPLVTVAGKPLAATKTVPNLDGQKVTKLRDLAIGDIGYDWRVDKMVILHNDGNEYIVRKDEVSLEGFPLR